jgi:hypothetical protein
MANPPEGGHEIAIICNELLFLACLAFYDVNPA